MNCVVYGLVLAAVIQDGTKAQLQEFHFTVCRSDRSVQRRENPIFELFVP